MNNRSFLGQPRHPVREVLRVLCGGVEPPDFVGGYSSSELTEAQYERLLEWVLENVTPGWSTGIGAIEAADRIVAEAVGNCNIPTQVDLSSVDAYPEEYTTEDGQSFEVKQSLDPETIRVIGEELDLD